MTNSSGPHCRQQGSLSAEQGGSGLAVTTTASGVPAFLRRYTAPLRMQFTTPPLNGRDKVFRNERDFWKGVPLLATVRLESFRLSDWFPRMPGVGCSPQANAIHEEWHADQPKLNFLAPLSKRQILERALRFDPHEEYVRKAGLADRMIKEGGLGTIRLLPKQLDGEYCWFGTAAAWGSSISAFPSLSLRLAWSGPQRRGATWST
jgi:hypothetical protein